jgi:chromosome segregation ATPase
MNPLLFGPALVKRVLDDLGAIAGAARRLPAIETEAFARVDAVQAELAALRADLRPIAELGAVREGIDALRADLRPIAELGALRAGMDAVREEIGALRVEMRPIQQLTEVRKGIEPLDEDIHAVRHSIDDIEPLVERVLELLAGMDAKLDDMRGDLEPLGDLAEKIPGVRRR